MSNVTTNYSDYIPEFTQNLQPEGLDNFNKFFNYLLLASGILEIIYLISPRPIKAMYERWDMYFGSKGVFHFTFTGMISLICLMFMGIFMLQESSIKDGSRDIQQRLQEPSYETNFRHRNQWMVESYYYQSQLIAIIWLSMNNIIKSNYKYNRKTQQLADMFKDAIFIPQ